MTAIFINSENSKISSPYSLLLNLTGKINLRRGDSYIALSNLSIHYTWKNIKMPYKNNKAKLSGSTWVKEFELQDRSYSVSDIQNYFECFIKKHSILKDTPNTSIEQQN